MVIRKLITEELMLLNCGVGEDSQVSNWNLLVIRKLIIEELMLLNYGVQESLGLQGDQTSQS